MHSTKDETQSQLVVQLYALARKLEGEGQYNVAKLARASADSILRTASYSVVFPSDWEQLGSEIQLVVEELNELQVPHDLVAALKLGGTKTAEGRLPMFEETPNPYVCRTCGHVEMQPPGEICPTCLSSPGTFQQFMPVYWLKAMDPFESLNSLKQTPDKVKRLIEGFGEQDLNREVFEGEWSIRNILSHLRDAQGVLLYRLTLLLEEENPVIESKAVFEWAKDESDRPQSATTIFKTYEDSREKTLEVLEGIPLVDWWRKGRHQEFGEVSVWQQTSYFATHELTHLPQIQSLCKKL
jgi:hypothetical protein